MSKLNKCCRFTTITSKEKQHTKTTATIASGERKIRRKETKIRKKKPFEIEKEEHQTRAETGRSETLKSLKWNICELKCVCAFVCISYAFTGAKLPIWLSRYCLAIHLVSISIQCGVPKSWWRFAANGERKRAKKTVRSHALLWIISRSIGPALWSEPAKVIHFYAIKLLERPTLVFCNFHHFQLAEVLRPPPAMCKRSRMNNSKSIGCHFSTSELLATISIFMK